MTNTINTEIQPILSLDEAWEEKDRLWAKAAHLNEEAIRISNMAFYWMCEGALVVNRAAEAKYGKGVKVNLDARAVTVPETENKKEA